MRREHNNGQSGESIPYKENLVFYAPLTQGDLTEHVSGANLVYGDGNVTWDNSVGMYLFTCADKNNETYFPVNLVSQGLTSKPYTIIAKTKPCDTPNYNYPTFVVIGGYSDTTSWRPSIFSYWGDYSGYRSEIAYRLEVVQSTLPYQAGYAIINDSVYTLFTETSANSITNPSGWSGILLQRVALCPRRESGRVYNAYIQDVRIYNRTFTNEELLYLVSNQGHSAPAVPSGLTATASSGGITISWNQSPGATSYKLYRGSTGSNVTLLTTLNGTSYTDSSPLSGYNCYKVVASNLYGDSIMSSAVTVNYVIPNAPTNVTAGQHGNTQVVVSWNVSSDATDYEVYRCSTENGTYILLDTVSTNRYVDLSPLTGDNYYKIKAKNSIGTSSFSSYAYVDFSGTTPSVIDDLLQLDCRFYAPLEQNDLSEQINNVNPTQGNATITWSSEKNAYCINASTDQRALFYTITGVNEFDTSTGYDHTIVFDIYSVSYGGNWGGTIDVVTIGQGLSGDGSSCASAIETHRFTGYSNGSWHRLMQKYVDSESKLYFYIDGTLVRTSNCNTSTFYQCNPRCWQQTNGMKNIVTLGGNWSNGQYYYTIYLKNVMMFNRALSTSEYNSLPQ